MWDVAVLSDSTVAVLSDTFQSWSNGSFVFKCFTVEDNSLSQKKKITVEDLFSDDFKIHDPEAKWITGGWGTDKLQCLCFTSSLSGHLFFISFFIPPVLYFAPEITESRRGWGWKGPQQIILSNSLLKQGQLELVAQNHAQKFSAQIPIPAFILINMQTPLLCYYNFLFKAL